MSARVLRELAEGIEKADLTALRSDSLPAVPDSIKDALNRIGGFVAGTDKPLYRIVSGLDPSLQEFAFGQWHRKYVSVRDTVRQITSVMTTTKSNFQKRVHTFEDAIRLGIVDQYGNPTPTGKKRFIIILNSEDELIEYGIPRYIIEKFRTAEQFGEPEEWEDARWISVGDKLNPTDKPIDALGEYPREGRYEFFVKIEDGLEDLAGNITATTFKPLTEAVIEQIADLIEMSNAPALETFEKIMKKADDKKAADEKAFDERLTQGIKENAGRITNMPQIGYGGSSRKTE